MKDRGLKPLPLCANVQYALPEADGALVAFNIGPDKVAYFVYALAQLDYRTEDPGCASFAKTVPDQPQRYRVMAMRGGDVELDITISGEPFNLHQVQPVGDDLLLACSRSRFRGRGDVDLNARLYDRSGRLKRAFCMGDGIETIQSTTSGDIWAAYFDEGVLGNYGWSDPLGAAGLVAWDDYGNKHYEFELFAGLDRIIDCYAINVASDDDVWLCYYTDFPLVHLRRRRIEGIYASAVAGSGAFAVDGHHALFRGGYREHDTLRLFPLITGEQPPRASILSPVDRDGAGIKFSWAVGRAGSLFVLDDAHLYEFTVADAVRALRHPAR